MKYNKTNKFYNFHLSIYEDGLKSSKDDAISVDFFEQWNPRTATPMEKVYGPQSKIY